MIETYDLAIDAGIRHDRAKAEQVLALLIATLRPEPKPELAISLRGIYHDCETYLEAENFAAFTESIERLKGLWLAYYKIHFPNKMSPLPEDQGQH